MMMRSLFVVLLSLLAGACEDVPLPSLIDASLDAPRSDSAFDAGDAAVDANAPDSAADQKKPADATSDMPADSQPLDGPPPLDRSIDQRPLDLPPADIDPCKNGKLDPQESDTDCGGPCAACAHGRACKNNSDCQSNRCHKNQCLDPCKVWQRTTPGLLRGAAVSAAEDIYAVGENQNLGYIVAYDRCGTAKSSKTHEDSRMARSGFHAVTLYDTQSLWVAGDAEPLSGTQGLQAYAGRYTTALAPIGTFSVVPGTAGDDRIIALGHRNNDILMGGIRDFRQSAQTGWGFKASAGTQSICGFALDPGQIQAVRVVGTDVYYVGSVKNGSGYHESFAARMNIAACSVSACGCKPTWQTRYDHQGANSKAQDAVVARFGNVDYLYLAGFWNVPGATTVDTGALVVRIRLDSPTTRKVFTWKPSVLIDSFSGIQADSQGIYVAGGQNVLYGDTATQGTPTVMSLDPDLNKRWETKVGSKRSFTDLELIGTDGLLLIGNNQAQGHITRCLRDGTCS
jgi:hypothetical protein